MVRTSFGGRIGELGLYGDDSSKTPSFQEIQKLHRTDMIK